MSLSLSLLLSQQQRDHVPSPTSPEEEGHDDDVRIPMRDLHSDYDHGDRTTVTESKATEREADDDDNNDDEEEGEEEEEEGGAIDPARALVAAALELRAREDKAAMDRLVVAMAGEGVVVWRHQSGFHKELVGGESVLS